MKILIFSDSHNGLGFMRECLLMLKPDKMIHLGDYYDDGQDISHEFPGIPMFQVTGNCDQFRFCLNGASTLLETLGGVRLYMTHGHRQDVKNGTQRLIQEAREAGAQAVLYGHTHRAECRQEGELWILNPGSCNSRFGSVGWMEIHNGRIRECRILTGKDMEAMK